MWIIITTQTYIMLRASYSLTHCKDYTENEWGSKFSLAMQYQYLQW